jgi:hypothetical protein
VRAGRRVARRRGCVAARVRIDRAAGGSLAFHAMSPFWIWTQALIVVCVLAGIVIATVKLL